MLKTKSPDPVGTGGHCLTLSQNKLEWDNQPIKITSSLWLAADGKSWGGCRASLNGINDPGIRYDAGTQGAPRRTRPPWVRR
jgi:hypothetical protein